MKVIGLSGASCAMIRTVMRLLTKLRVSEETGTPPGSETSARDEALCSSECVEESALIRTIGWISAGLGAVAIGLIVGHKLRQRYKFNRRTPYDFYAHSGDGQEADFGLGT